ncbi:MAG: antitoxin [Gemmatimonas sp.]|jgi:hypothetical protein|uniref:hypothetical protein n=1 Tax=Gemmatimonas sp. TaxID=1962908 RepID=UPI0022BB2CE7|nr:hypothetical protein [Gemmatimonas sp.]MCA2983416.1 antitoxin [Gemmatimonas sp.]MCA2988702.1 antitoxin [Gemmatimonas sp.]MCA2994568.1 antitoxin [Gemmatimonas sp.]MCZ8013677.1 hypothetical protein [Gemmatimonas sp.]MCZ8267584.1 hypothetical protein [Gemmatimonas sp.]
MSTRLQVVLDDEELLEIKQAAASQRLTVAEWVRQALRKARAAEPRYLAEHKLRVVRESAQFGYPTANIETLLGDTARGRLSESE